MAGQTSRTWTKKMARLISHTREAVSWMFVFKAAAGCAVSALALFGVTVPHLGFETTPFGEVAAALSGGVLGSLIALKG